MKLLKQQCPMVWIYFSWALYLAGLAFFSLQRDYVVALTWLVVLPIGVWAYVRVFPAVSRYLGYGRIDDQPASMVDRIPAKVTLYTALGCPFCPVVKRRLLDLQAEMGFDLDVVDVTLKPDLLLAKGIRAVPVVEAGAEQLVGHATSQQLSDLIRSQAAAA
ncbi:MAG: glutaredoxin family protein [Anaerolineae bacterium]